MEYWLLNFLLICQFLWEFDFLFTQDNIGLEISKRYSYIFHLIATTFQDAQPGDGGRGVLAVKYLGNLPAIKNLMALRIFFS